MCRLSRLAISVGLITSVLMTPHMSYGGNLLKLSIIHMNDCHGHYLPHKSPKNRNPVGGYARAATAIIKAIEKNRQEGRETLILHAGDLLTGTPFSIVWKGRLGLKMLNAMHFDAMTVGNHEFDQGSKHLIEKLVPSSKFPFLSANTRYENGNPVFKASIKKEFSPSRTRVLVFGLTTEQTPTSTHPKNVKGLQFLPIIETARELLKSYTDKDLIIALTHVGILRDRDLAEAVPKIDVIVGGHSHTAILSPLEIAQSLIVQAGSYASYVGKLDLDVQDGKVVKYSGRLIRLVDSIPDDPKIATMINEAKSQMDSKLQEVIGRTEIFLDGSLRNVRSGINTNFGSLLTWLMRTSVNADAAVLNGGTIRASLHTGDITLGEILTSLPFGNRILSVDLKGEDVREVLQHSETLSPYSGGKLQTCGIVATSNNGQVEINSIGGKPFNPQRTYTIAINDFLFAGGDGYLIFKDKGKLKQETSMTLSERFVEFIKEQKVLTPDKINKL